MTSCSPDLDRQVTFLYYVTVQKRDDSRLVMNPDT